MTDMLVKLYNLPPLHPELERQAAHGITVRRAISPERHVVLAWVREHFGEYWESECNVAFSRNPPSIFLATLDGALIGFACYDTTAKGFFGPTGVSEAARGKGTGKALLIAALDDMRQQGYGYAAIGGVGPIEFYAKAVGATIIEDSTPGIYKDMLRG